MTAARILIVDDSLTIRRALEFILKPHGYALDFAADGREALDRAAAFGPDLVLLDYVLPDMRGPDVCAALSAMQETASTPVILVSAKGASIRQAYQDAQNVVSYITKPFKPEVVIAVVANALSRGRTTATPAPAATGAPPRPEVLSIPFASLPPARERATAAPEASKTKTPITVGETFSAFLNQLEDAISADAATAAPHGVRLHEGATRGPAEAVRPGLERLTARMRELTDHLVDGTVAPYRLRRDGSFANIAATLLEAHRCLCEAAIALAAAGTPGPRLPSPPRLIAAVPPAHPLAGDVRGALQVTPEIAGVAIEGDFEQLPYLVKLLRPDVVVAAQGTDPQLDEALRRAAALAAPGTRFVAVGAPDSDSDGNDGRERLTDAAAVANFVGELARQSGAADEAAPTLVEMSMEVVAV